MYLDKQTALKVNCLIQPECKEAFNLLLTELEKQLLVDIRDSKPVYELRNIQGKLVLVAELRQLEDRIKDGLKR